MTKLVALTALVAAVLITAAAAAAAGNQDYQHPSTPPAHPTEPQHPTEPVHPATPPATHDCTFTGAGKDGHPGNDDCAPVTVPPSVVVVPTPPVVQIVTVEKIVEKLVPGPERLVTVTKIVKAKPKVVTKIKRVVVVKHKTTTKVVFRDRIKCPPFTKLVSGKCMVPGKG
jgi:hypothetical protein